MEVFSSVFLQIQFIVDYKEQFYLHMQKLVCVLQEGKFIHNLLCLICQLIGLLHVSMQ